MREPVKRAGRIRNTAAESRSTGRNTCMVAHSRRAGILSGQRIPSDNGASGRLNMDICPDMGGRFGRTPPRLSAVILESPFARQGRNDRGGDDQRAATTQAMRTALCQRHGLRPTAFQFHTEFQYPGRGRTAKRHGLRRSTSSERQRQTAYRGVGDAFRDPGANQQTLPTDLLGRTDNGRLNRPRWVSGGI